MSKRIRNMVREIEGFIDEAKHNLKYKWETRNDCPECDGVGEELEEIIEGWSRYEYCGWCDGEGKMTVARRWEWQWYCKIRPAIVNFLKRVVPKKVQAAYDKRLYARMEKEWQDEMRCMKGE